MPGLRNGADFLVNCCRLMALMVFVLLGIAVMAPQSFRPRGPGLLPAAWSPLGLITLPLSYLTARYRWRAAGSKEETTGFVFYLSSGEIYDPATSNWSTTGSVVTARGYHSAILLPNGKVLLAGAGGINGTYLASLAERGGGPCT
jgi:hypothetical protein